jgi:hypothetical protein
VLFFARSLKRGTWLLEPASDRDAFGKRLTILFVACQNDSQSEL